MLEDFNFTRLAAQSLSVVFLQQLLDAIVQLGQVLEKHCARENHRITLNQLKSDLGVHESLEPTSLEVGFVHHAPNYP